MQVIFALTAINIDFDDLFHLIEVWVLVLLPKTFFEHNVILHCFIPNLLHILFSSLDKWNFFLLLHLVLNNFNTLHLVRYLPVLAESRSLFELHFTPLDITGVWVDLSVHVVMFNQVLLL